MKVYVQWTLKNPQNWVELDLNTASGVQRWANLPKKPEPVGGEALDNFPGWTFDINIQGVCFYGFDHVALEPIALGGVRAYGWNTDIEDPDPQVRPYRWGEVWDLYPPAPDPNLGGQINTRQYKTIYSEVEAPDFVGQRTAAAPVDLREWSDFTSPADALTRHGIWVPDEENWKKHFEVRDQHGWREWVQ